MLDRTITADKYNELPDDVKSHYVKRGSSYVIDLNGDDPELVATQTTLDKERKTNIELASQVRTLTQDAAGVEERVRTETATEIKTLKEQNATLTTTQVTAEKAKHVDAIAGLFKLDNLIRADLQGRVTVEIVDGVMKTTFKDKDGKEVDFKTLNEEYCKNPDYSGILKDNTSTSTFQPPKGGGGTQPVKKDDASGGLDYSKATDAEIAARLESIT